MDATQLIGTIHLVLSAAPIAAASFQGLGDLPGGNYSSTATAISADGIVVVGDSWVADGTRAFRWTSSSGMVLLDSSMSNAYTLSADGSTIVGENASQAVYWAGGVVKPLPMFYAYGISSNGSVIAGIGSGASSIQAYRWTSATGAEPLGYLSGGNHSTSQEISADGLVIVGTSGSTAAGSLSEAMRWTSASGMVGLGDLPGGFFDSWAADSSADGSVVVGSSRAEAGYEAYRWTAGTGMVSLGDLSGGIQESVAHAISSDGSIIVGYGNSLVGQEAMIWTTTGGTQSLKSLLLASGIISVRNWQLTEAFDISADGSRIVGTGINPDGNAEAWIAIIPEPTSIALAALAVLGVVGRWRLRDVSK